LIEEKYQITVQVSCLFYFLLSRFFKGKVKSGFVFFLVGFIVFFKWTFKKKTGCVFLGRIFCNPGLNKSMFTLEILYCIASLDPEYAY